MLLRLARAYPAAYVDRVVFHQRQHTGARGPAHMRIDGAEVWDRQIAFDARVLRKVHERGDLRDFLPRSKAASPLTPEKTARALITRAAALGRRRLWNLAGNDVAEALAIAGREPIARLPDPVVATLSDAYRAQGIADVREAAPSVLDVVSAHPETPLRRQLLDELSWVDLSRTGRSASRRQWRAARHHAADYLRTTRGTSLLRHIAWMAARLGRRMRRD